MKYDTLRQTPKLRISYGSFMQTKHLCVLNYIRLKGELCTVNRSRNVLTGRSKGVFLLWNFFVYFTVASVTCVSFLHMALLYVMLYCAFVILPYGVLRQVWYLIVLISEIYLGSAEFRQTAEFEFKPCKLY